VPVLSVNQAEQDEFDNAIGIGWDMEVNVSRLRLGFGAAVFAALVLIATFAGTSSALASNADCLMCHETDARGQQFQVIDVDRDTVCAACHLPGLVGTHPLHQPGSACSAYCHDEGQGWGNSLLTAIPYYSDSAGAFSSANSKNTPSSILHIIHSTSRWPSNIDTADSRCASCHSIAACDACHVNDPSDTHATHGNETPWSGTVGHGVSAGDQTMNSAGPDSNECASAGCHDIASIQGNRSHLRENFSHAANPAAGYPDANIVTTTGYWRTRYSVSHTYGRMSYSNQAGATLAVTFNGERVQLIADRDPYRGIGEVWIDGAYVATVDLYAPTTTNQATVFDSDTLSSGTHTIQVKVLGTKSASSRAAYFSVDAFEVYSEMPDSIAPECVTCHADKSSGHGGSFDHVATQTVDAAYPGTAVTCTDCHSMSMWTEHGRTSSKTAVANCSACHTTYADFTLDTYGGTCAESPCHQASNGQAPHNFTDSNHTASDGSTAECRSCHGSDLSVIHDDSNAARDQHASLSVNSWATDCLVCHGTDTYPTTKDCTDSGCHGGSGVVSMATHPAPAHDGTNTNAGVLRTGSNSCSTCHLLELTAEHGKASSVTDPGGAEIGCPQCHNADYFPNGWLDTDGTTNTCNACHDPAGASDAGLPHEASEYTAKHDWTATNGSGGAEDCAGSLCHDVDRIDFIHTDPWNATVTSPRGSSCESCHDDPEAIPTEDNCVDCHTTHATALLTAHDPQSTPAITTANADCLACHTKFLGGGGLVLHAGMCYTCHNTLASNKLDHYLQDNYTQDCQDCHNSSVLGAYEYQPYDPNHYDPYLASHTANYGSESVDTSWSVVTEKACTSCHANSLKAEHAYTLSIGAVNCIDCHSSTTPINASAQVAAGWTNDKSVDCHGTNHGGTGLASHEMTASATSLGCSVSGCHATDTDDLAKLHADADNGATSCNVCHASADTSLAAVTGCDSSGCHTTGHDMSVHVVTTDTGNCLRCHEQADGSAASDLRDVHADCATCHDNATYPGIITGKTSDCVDCHAAGLVAEPHAGSGGDYDTYEPNHYVGTESTHAADGLDTGFSNTDGNSCVSCHLLEMKPEHFKTTSAFASVPGTYADKCVGCHEVAVDTITGAWDNSCLECHTTGSTHTAFNTAHNASAAYDTSCGGGGCHDTDNADLIHKNSVTGNATVTTCLNTCHDSNTDLPASVSCDTSGCHAGGHGHTLDLLNSDYDNGTIEGCTNSGAGCHGTSSGTDYTAYHPDSGCSTGACHDASALNHDNAQFNGESTCQNCHGGGTLLYTNAPDAVALTEPSATGHYNESLHDIGAFLGLVRGVTGGSTTARCNDCHSRDGGVGGMDGLWVQHQGLDDKGDVTCADCHNAFSAVVADNWSTPSCGDCHNGANMTDAGDTRFGHAGGVAPAGINGTGSGCGAVGCHGTLDLHILHKGDGVGSDPACSECHDYSGQGAKPTQTTCGTGQECHDTSPQHPGEDDAHDVTIAVDEGGCVECHEINDIRVQHSNDCGTCHNSGKNLGGAAASNSANCVDCHNDTSEAGDVYFDSSDSPTTMDHYDANVDTHTADSQITTQNWGTTSYGVYLERFYPDSDAEDFSYEVPCSDCHTTDLYTEHSKSTIDGLSGYANECVACHELEVDAWGTTWDNSCGGNSNSCHDVDPSGNLHMADSSRVATSTWADKHDGTNWGLDSPGTDFSDVGGGGGGGGSWSTEWSDSFDANLNNWTAGNSWDWNAGAAQADGSGSANTYLDRDGTLDLSGYDNARVSFTWRSNAAETGDVVEFQYFDGSWQVPTGGTIDLSTNPGTAQPVSFDITNTTTDVRFRYNANAGIDSGNDYVWVDDFVIEGETVVVPLGSGFSDGFESNDFTAWTSVDEPAAGAPTTVFSDGFESGNLNAWTSSSAQWTANNAQSNTGSWSGRGNPTVDNAYVDMYLTKTVDLSGLSGDATLDYDIMWTGTETEDIFDIQYYDGSWTTLNPGYDLGPDQAWRIGSSATIPQAATQIRFHYNANYGTDLLYIDDVSLTGPLPASIGGWEVQGTAMTGSYAARATGEDSTTRYLTKTAIDTAGADSVSASWAISWASLEVADSVVVQSYNGSTWTSRKSYTLGGSQAWMSDGLTGLPADTVGIRFAFTGDAVDDLLYVDDVSVTPVAAGGGGAAGSAGASCQNNPNGEDCHDVSDVADIHARLTDYGCPTCHVDNTDHPVIVGCQDTGCHVGVNLDEHIQTGTGTPAHHETTNVFGGAESFSPCTACHDDSMANEHFVLTNPEDFTSTPCSVCHKTAYTQGGTFSPAKATVLAEIAEGSPTYCEECHTASSKSSPHVQRWGDDENGAAALGETQFDDTWNGHRMYSSMPGAYGNMGPTKPGVTTWLLSGYQNTTMIIECTDCHGSVTGATGPHGASMAVNYADNGGTPYNDSYTNGALEIGNSWDDNGQAGDPLCSKCHNGNTRNYQAAHGEGGHGGSDGVCTVCHTPIPHAWKRPNLLGYTTDPGPYATSDLRGVALNPGTSWGTSDCDAGCYADHNNTGLTRWP
jgi:hypothetical protein